MATGIAVVLFAVQHKRSHVQLSVPSLRGRLMYEYQQKLGSKRAYHAIHCLRMRGLAASADVWLRAKETEISAALWALRPGNGLYFALLISLL